MRRRPHRLRWRRIRRGPGAIAPVAASCILAAVLAGAPQPAFADEIRGRVQRADGSPVFDADFDVFDQAGNLLAADDNSDLDGSYAIVLPPGRYDLVCEPSIPSGLAPQVRRGVLIGGQTRLDWILPPSVRVIGRVLGPGDVPVGGADLDFDRIDDGTRQPALGDLTSRFGTFATYIEPGAYRVTVFPPDSLGLAPAQLQAVTVSDSDTLLFRLQEGRHLEGRVRGPDGIPVDNVKLSFDDTDLDRRVPAGGNRTDVEGRYRAVVAPGRYRVQVAPPRGTGLVARRLGPIDLTGDAILDVDLDRGMVLSGTVLDAQARPLAGADWDVADEATGTSLPTPDDNTDFDGRYTLVVPAGTYRLTLTPPPASGLQERVFHNVVVDGPRAFDVNYAAGAAGAGIALTPAVNPVHTTGDVLLDLPVRVRTRIVMYDIRGRPVRTLLDATLPAGRHRIPWDGRGESGALLRPSVYFLVAESAAGSVRARWVVLP